MAGPYYVWSGATGSATGADWTNAVTTLAAGVALASANEIVYVHTGASSTHAENVSGVTCTGPIQGQSGPIFIIGVDKDNSDAYTASSTANVTLNSSGSFTFDGDFAVYGLRFAVSSTGNSVHATDYNERQYFRDCYWDASAGTSAKYLQHDGGGYTEYVNCVMTSGSDDSYIRVGERGRTAFIGCSISSSGALLGIQVNGTGVQVYCYGCDFSGLTASGCDVMEGGAQDYYELYGCVLPPNGNISSGTQYANYRVYESDTTASNSALRNERNGPGSGLCVISTSTYRSGGATYDGTNEYSLVLSKGNTVIPQWPSVTDWNSVYVSSTGSTTFTVYIANATKDMDDTECWLEVEYFGSASTTLKTIATDGETDPTVAIGSGTVQTDDTSSTWSPSKTYMQKLSVTATVNRVGMARWRVCSNVTTDIYIDPAIDVT